MDPSCIIVLTSHSCMYLLFQTINFIAHHSPGSDYGYRAHGKLSRLVYSLLQKIKRSGVLPEVEEWENYVLPNLSSFAPIEEEKFLEGAPVRTAFEKMVSLNLINELRSSARRILEDFTSTVLSTVAARS